MGDEKVKDICRRHSTGGSLQGFVCQELPHPAIRSEKMVANSSQNSGAQYPGT